jgi:hypothetical protein
MVRELLPEDALAEYNEDVDGYSPGTACSWGIEYGSKSTPVMCVLVWQLGY